MGRITRQIKVAAPEGSRKRFEGKIFRSYRAVARELNPGEKVVVSVKESLRKDFILAGFGKVELVDGTIWKETGRLSSDL